MAVSDQQQHQLHELRALLSPEELFEPGQAGYKEQSAPWSKAAELHPKLVVQPASLPSLQQVVRFLYASTTLDFAVRNTGTGSVSARDVILSTHGFKDFAFDKAAEIVTLGAGFAWGEIDALMEERAPGYAVVGARCPWVGVTGSTLVGGLSWLSSEFGLISDPQNLLDMQVVLADGRALWASAEPDLLWALRGGGGNFGVVTSLKLRARPYPTTAIFSGVLALPHSSLAACSAGLAAMARRTPSDPRVALMLVNQGPGLGFADQVGARPGIGIMMFDARGAAHARGPAAFQWAFELPGAQELAVGEMSLRQVHAVSETFRDYEGRNLFWLCAPLLAELDAGTLVRAWEWYAESVEAFAGFGVGSTVVLEVMQEGAYTSSGSRAATAWPHGELNGKTGRRHVMQLVLGCRPEGAPKDVRELAMQRFRKAGEQIAGGPGKETGEYHVGFLHDWMDVGAIYAENYGRLRGVKGHYDPDNRFDKSVDLVGREG
ncbi:hypothetical protein LTR36_007220 [Oleoguttula mirabilis]|uniref:FAD-binding PCMH-type domain-containing protein n=1 Tax=Oleoguttula mirabilis TaxID=1507867 RepID=A0AAV9JAU7_9PEZI|nr:hypothetical protein LTR36_007220 [Oleoguttula mirabilis]